MNNVTKKSKVSAREAYRNRMNAYMKGMKELAGKKKALGNAGNKEGAKS